MVNESIDARRIVESDHNGNDISVMQPRGMVDVAQTRAAQEVQAAVIMAKRYPRDETNALTRILNACRRKPLAEQSQYVYPRGGTQVTGPSIRLAEVLAQNWGNIDFGIVELEQRRGESVMMAYCWDLETNVRQTRTFTVRHERHTRDGAYKLTDPRDIYEMTANLGARRVRACILGIVPGDIVDAAIEACDKTMAGNSSDPIIDRVRKMVLAFAELGVTQNIIEVRLGHKLDATTEQELANLRKIFQSIRDGMSPREQWFNVPPADGDGEENGSSDEARPGQKPSKGESILGVLKRRRGEQGAEDVQGEPDAAQDEPGDEAQTSGDEGDDSLNDEIAASIDAEKEQKRASKKS